MDASCKTCPFFASAYEPGMGLCRRNPPVIVTHEPSEDVGSMTHENPEVPEGWWCGEHPLRQRDRLAAMALQGIMSHPDVDYTKDTGPCCAAVLAYRFADAMLAARASDADEGAGKEK